MKKFLVGTVASGLMLGSMASAVFAASPVVGVSPAAPNAQCETAASSGAFNFQNEVYAPNSREFGLAGGSGGGQTGVNNSGVCGNR